MIANLVCADIVKWIQVAFNSGTMCGCHVIITRSNTPRLLFDPVGLEFRRVADPKADLFCLFGLRMTIPSYLC
jgi:hypothetical protein